MRESNNIDQLFQDHFAEHKVEVKDRENLWKKIRSVENRRRGYIFLFLFGVISLISSAQFSSNYGEASYVSSSTANLDNVLNANQLVQPQLSSAHGGLIHDLENLKTNDTDESDGLISDFQKLNISEESVSWNAVRLSKAVPPDVDSDIKKRRTTEDIVNDQNSNKLLSGKTSVLGINDKSQLSSEQLGSSTRSISLLKGSNQVRKSQDLTMLSNEIDPLPLFLAPHPLKPNGGFMRKCDANKVGLSTFVDIYATAGYTLENVGLSSLGSELLAYQELWESRYNPLASISTGIAIGIETNSGVRISTGLEYQRLETQYLSTQTITETTTIYNPEAFFFFDQNNEIVWVGDSVTSVTTFDRTEAFANTFELINLPVHLSYPLTKSGLFTVSATVGGIINLSMNYEGRHLEPNGSLQLVSSSNRDQFFLPRIGLGVEGGFDINYLLDTNWEAYISPRYRWNQSSYYREQTIISVSRDFVNIRVGVRYLF